MPGKTVFHYEILGFLDRGGMGAVHRARDVRLDREVAVMVLSRERAADEESECNFLARTQGLLSRVDEAALEDVSRAEREHADQRQHSRRRSVDVELMRHRLGIGFVMASIHLLGRGSRGRSTQSVNGHYEGTCRNPSGLDVHEALDPPDHRAIGASLTTSASNPARSAE